MGKDSNIIIRIDSDIKKEFQKLVYEKGYTSSLIINAFIYDVVEKNKIPNSVLSKLKPVKSKNEITIPIIKKCLKEILDNCEKNEDIKKVYLFGSYARGEENFTSDIDIRMEVEGKINYFDLVEISDLLEQKLGKKIDLITSSNLEPMFYEEIKKDEICIYE